jgi:hypothetical protein
MRNSLTLIFLLLFACPGLAQVENDNIAKRIELLLDSVPVKSTTKKATVEWNCINKALTNACLVYHNDQWFYFHAAVSGKRYLNITNQRCKNFKGVQVVIIEGNPCETTSYKLVHCISFTDQNDVFITLDSLKTETTYLVLIDGFLGDQCDFEVQFSTRPAGIPVFQHTRDTLSLYVEQDRHVVVLNWNAHPLQLGELDRFEIFRQHTKETKSVKLTDKAVETNAQGKHREQYNLTDTLLNPGTYTYRIAGVSKTGDHRVLLAERQVHDNPQGKQPSTEQYIIEMPVNFTMTGDVEVIVTDAQKGNVLFGFTVPDGQNIIVPVDVTRFVNQGIRFFSIRSVHIKSRNASKQTFALDHAGKWIAIFR